MNELAELSSLRADLAVGDQWDLASPRELLQAEIRAARQQGQGAGTRHAAWPARARRPWPRAGRRHLPGARRALSRRLAASLAAVAAAGAAVMVTAGLLAGPGRPVAAGGHAGSAGGPAGSTVLTAAYVLGHAAAAQAPGPAPGPGRYVTMSSIAVQMGTRGGRGGQVTRSWLTTSHRQIWLSASGRKPGALRIDLQKAVRLPWGGEPPAFAGRRLLWRPEPTSSCPASTPGTYPYLASLPTDTSRLRAWMYAHPEGGTMPANDQAWKQITSLLGTMPVPPKLAAALFRVAATIPGTTVVPRATDAAGRAGIAVARLDPSARANVELVFDRASYRFLGERTVLAAPVTGVGPAGTVIGSTAQLGVTTVGHLPPGSAAVAHHAATGARGGASGAGC